MCYLLLAEVLLGFLVLSQQIRDLLLRLVHLGVHLLLLWLRQFWRVQLLQKLLYLCVVLLQQLLLLHLYLTLYIQHPFLLLRLTI